MKFIKFLVLFTITSHLGYSQPINSPLVTEDYEAQTKWVDSVYNAMTLKHRIGQLFMVDVFSRDSKANTDAVKALIENHKIGGVIFSKGGPYRQAKLTNEFQAISKTPLLIGMDAEWGLSMRLDSTYAFPWNMTLGAIQDNELIFKTGKHIGEHCKRLGVHINFAPDVDININPNNPIIGNRSFGEDKFNVASKAEAFFKGLQSVGVLANAKHFPGHGDTDKDSHKTLPTINFTKDRIENIELFPYKQIIDKGLASVMIAHLNVPSYDPREGYPSSISKSIVTDLLKTQLGFNGLIFTDALNMKGASNFSSPGDIDLAAFMAGNDMLLISENIPKGIQKIEEAYANGQITAQRLAHSVKKILMAKYKTGLNQYKPINTANLSSDLNRLQDDILSEELYENAITLIRNESLTLPIQNLDAKKIAYVKLGDAENEHFISALKRYAAIDVVAASTASDLLAKLAPYTTVIVGYHKSNDSPWQSYKFSAQDIGLLKALTNSDKSIVLNLFARPYALLDIEVFNPFEAILISYQNSKISQEKSAQIIFGAIGPKGKLPVSVSDQLYRAGYGIHFNPIQTLGYSIPERVGMDSFTLAKIDSIAKHTINQQMAPGLQVLVARFGKVVYNKAFGNQTYDRLSPVVTDTTLYDLASLTKVLATLPLIMEMEERGILSLDTKLEDILPDYLVTNKAEITIKQMLSHYAKLKPWIPFYVATLDSATRKPSSKYYSKTPNGKFSLKVSDHLYMREDYQDSIQKIIQDTELLSKLSYRYSDLPYYILKAYIESFYDNDLANLSASHFYKPLGANYTTYNPLNTFNKASIAPTEIDDYYRYQEVKGYVHDMGAAMQNGIGGHAGLFSTANDVAKLMQMYLQNGFYGGKRYFKPETIAKFNSCYYCDKGNRRGVGFDKPQLGDTGPTCGCLSMSSFGHSGFTGTYTWADPEKEIVYVFLANRTYPKATNNVLLKENIRTNIQRVIYDAVIQ